MNPLSMATGQAWMMTPYDENTAAPTKLIQRKGTMLDIINETAINTEPM